MIMPRVTHPSKRAQNVLLKREVHDPRLATADTPNLVFVLLLNLHVACQCSHVFSLLITKQKKGSNNITYLRTLFLLIAHSLTTYYLTHNHVRQTNRNRKRHGRNDSRSNRSSLPPTPKLRQKHGPTRPTPHHGPPQTIPWPRRQLHQHGILHHDPVRRWWIPQETNHGRRQSPCSQGLRGNGMRYYCRSHQCNGRFSFGIDHDSAAEEGRGVA